jgi:hypothetical protein
MLRRVLAAWVAGIALGGSSAAQTGLTPLTDLGPGLYQGFPGGLYPGGSNHPPAAHQAAAMQHAAQVVPRNALGTPSASGLIGLIAIGMSNTTHEFAVFERNEDLDRKRNPRLVILDTGVGGQTAATIADPSAAYWTSVQNRVTAMGMTAAQVQVAWLKEADANPADDFPVHADTLKQELAQIARNLRAKFPNLRLCYLSSRIYGGYAPPGSLNPEPQAYESGFSVKWVIEDQIAGDPGLNHGQLPGDVQAPLLLWGPYLWADGTNPRADGLTWEATDFESDHTHPGPTGEAKVAALLSAFFAGESTAVPWWPARSDASVGIVSVAATKDAHVSAATPGANFGAAPTLVEQGGATPSTIHLGFDVTSVARPVALAKLSLRVASGGGGGVYTVASTAWAENAVTWSSAPATGALLVQLPQSTRDGTIGAGVAASVNADADGLLGFALATTAAGQATYPSKEGGEAPRLVLLASCAASPDGDGDGRADPCDCAPGDPSAHGLAFEVTGVRWTDRDHLAWNAQAAAAGAGIRYDVVMGTIASLRLGFGPDFCAAFQTATPGMVDLAPSFPGQPTFFLVRAGNACGLGRWNTASDGSDLATPLCSP